MRGIGKRNLFKDGGFVSYCLKNKWLLIVSVAISVLMSVILYYSYQGAGKSFVFDESGVKAISKDALGDVILRVKAVKNGSEIEREIMLRGDKKKSGVDKSILLPGEYSEEDEMDIEITRMTMGLNRTLDEDLVLPQEIGEGIELKWERSDSQSAYLIMGLFPPLIMLFMYREQKDRVKKAETNLKNKMLLRLPEFNNKLVLLMGSGLVYEESIRRIGSDEGMKDDELTALLKKLIQEADSTNRDVTQLLNRYAGKSGINDLKRMTAIITENRRMGTNLVPRLEVEGEILWEKRKKKAEEQGKLAESKLTLPLGIMLISLLIVTAGPAILQM